MPGVCISAPSLQFTHSTAQLVPSARAHSEHPRYAAVLCPLLLHRVSSFYLIAYSQLTTQPREPFSRTRSVFHRMRLSMVIPIGLMNQKQRWSRSIDLLHHCFSHHCCYPCIPNAPLPLGIFVSAMHHALICLHHFHSVFITITSIFTTIIYCLISIL